MQAQIDGDRSAGPANTSRVLAVASASVTGATNSETNGPKRAQLILQPLP